MQAVQRRGGGKFSRPKRRNFRPNGNFSKRGLDNPPISDLYCWQIKNTPRGYCICPEGGIKLKKETYDVTGMSCAACSSRVEKAVAKQPGAQQVAVNLLKNSMVVEYDESQL